VVGYSGYSALGNLVADHVSLALGQNSRFEVYERSRLQDVMNEKRLAELFANPREAQKLRGIVPVQYLVYGKILRASCPISQNTNYDKKHKRSHTSYSATAAVSIAHYITEVATGKVMKSVETTGSKSSYASDSEPAVDPLIREACADAVRDFVRAFIPHAKGSVTEKLADGQVMINLGSSDGVGTDVDLLFVRKVPILDATGKPVMRNGEPLTEQKSFGPDNKPKDLCVARPVHIEKDYCIADVGYDSRGSFFGHPKFKKSLDHFNAVQVGDMVILNQRPEQVE
jgi:hypothetical protein